MTTSAHAEADPSDTQLGNLRSSIVRYLRRRRVDEDIAQDLTQETLIRCVRSTESPRNLRAFAIHVARNLMINQWRDRHQADSLDSSIAAGSSHRPSRPLRTVEQRVTIERAVAGLPSIVREVVRMRHDDGMSFAAIAEILDVTEAAVRKRYTRALGSLRAQLAG